MAATKTKWKVAPNALYACDSGHTYCGRHLGRTAMDCGRDISGQRVHRYTDAEIRYAQSIDARLDCGECRRLRVTEIDAALQKMSHAKRR